MGCGGALYFYVIGVDLPLFAEDTDSVEVWVLIDGQRCRILGRLWCFM
jgi:hypothetical protein